MFRLLYSKGICTDLLRSQLFCEKTFYSAFERDLRKSKSEVLIESPFIACKRTESLLPVFRRLTQRGVKVRINTRNPAHHEQELRIQAWQSIKMLRSTGVKVRFYNDMRHRKLAVVDRAVLWEGSLNIMSQSYSKEIMRRTVSPDLAKQMIRFTGMTRWSW